jgi:photosystem II stability/assembly factor-like uncharacterized protein
MTTEREWERVGPIEEGGTVLGLCVGSSSGGDTAWAMTGTVPFRSDDGADTWHLIGEGSQRLQLVTIVYGPPGILIAGDVSGNVLRSLDGGRSWVPVDPFGRAGPVACLAVSPNFRTDNVVLLGTDGDGMWRSSDNGRHWEEVNFGLLDLTVMAVACAPEWERYEYAFAGTADGVYRSRNGGRAWEPANAGLEGVAISALGVSPGFLEDRTVYAGTEERGVYRSRDKGESWENVSEGLGEAGINAMWISPHFETDKVLVVGASNGIFRSEDGGERWLRVTPETAQVLCMSGNSNGVYAGVVGEGVLRSTDLGRSWAPARRGLVARNYARLMTCSSGTLLALGSEEGVAQSEDGGASWARLPIPDEHLPLTTIEAIGISGGLCLLLAGTYSGGLIRSDDGGDTWEQVGESVGVRSILVSPDFQSDQMAWAGSDSGQLLVSRDAGKTWTSLATPYQGERVLRLAASPYFSEDGTLFVGTFLEGEEDSGSAVRVWRSTDRGTKWQLYLEREGEGAWLSVALPPSAAREPYNAGIFGIGSRLFRPSGGGRLEETIFEGEPAILEVLALPRQDRGFDLYAATSQGIYARPRGGKRWKDFSAGLPSELILSLAPSPGYEQDGTLYALAVGGTLWSRKVR